MKLEERFPQSGLVHNIGSDNKELDALYPEIKGFRFNYVVSPKQSDGISDAATNDLDRALLRHIRSQSDLIITSGKTARAENLNSSRFAPMLILTESVEPIDIPATKIESDHSIYLTQRLETEYSNPNAIAVGTFLDSLTNFCLMFCKANIFDKPVLETGLEVAQQFANTGLLSEINLTVTGESDFNQAKMISDSFLKSLGVNKPQTIQILSSGDTFFFRFAPSQANFE